MNDEDIIYRQDAIDALRHVDEYNNRSIKAIKQLPSAEPEERTKERAETHACDLIDRQAAIDVCNSAIDLWHGQLGEGALVAVKEGIEGLPSAESEPDPEWRKKHYEISYNQGFVDACKHYENLPERKKGKWSIKNGEIAFWDVCSECKKMVIHKVPLYNYCPNCGNYNGGEEE